MWAEYTVSSENHPDGTWKQDFSTSILAKRRCSTHGKPTSSYRIQMCKKSQRKETVRLLGTGFTKPITETERQIVQEIIQENFVLHELSAADLICIDSYESKSKRGTYNVIFLASPTAPRLLSAVEGRIRYFEDRISLSDYTSINSCMKCGSLEHTATQSTYHAPSVQARNTPLQTARSFTIRRKTIERGTNEQM